MAVMTENKVIPKLRFSEFNEEWEIIRLQDLAIRITEKNRDNKIQTVLTNSATKGIVSQADYFDRDIANKNNLNGYYIVNIGDYVYNPRISKYAPVGPIKKNNLVLGLMSPLYSVFRFNTNEDEFFENYFETTAWHKYMKSVANYGARHDRMNISNSDFFKMSIPIPSLSEQQKIASFLSAIDEKLQQLNKKKSLLEEYKKGVMQKIFSQELRFKDDNGNNYSDWKDKKLGDIGETFNGLTGKTKEDFGRGKPFIQYMQIFNSAKIDTSKFGYVDIKEGEKQKTVQYGDIFFTTSSETPIEIGYSSVLTEEIEGLYLNSFCFGYRPNSLNELYPDFASYLFRSESLRKQIVKLAQGSTRYNMSKVQLMKVLIQLPSLDEQQKIANFLSSLDNKIDLVNTQIENTQAFKKGLLQQMFV